MGKDTKYLTLAAIVLMGIATLIVLTSKKNKPLPSLVDESISIPSTENDYNSSTKKDLYKDETSNTTEPNSVADAYKVLGGDTKIEEPVVSEKTTRKESAAKQKQVSEPTPASYEEPIKPNKEKFTEKSGEVKKPKPKVNPAPKSIAEDTGPVYIVQTGVLANADAALKAQQSLVSKGYKSAGTFQSGKSFLVYAGKFQSKSSADELKKRLDKAKISAFVKELR
jgi:cell division septation protein DedD